MNSKDTNTLKAGGGCTYRSYDGFARIMSVDQTVKSKHQAEMPKGPGYEGYEIYFVIFLNEEISESWARKGIERERLFTLNNSWLPGKRYLEKYGLEVGKDLPIEVKVIQKGTCTPIIVEFKTVDRGDYFESE